MEVGIEADEKLFQTINDLRFALNEANQRNRYTPVIQNYKSYKETFNKLLQLDETITLIQIQHNAIKEALDLVKAKLEEVIQEI
jgi:hypothetical protein